MTRRAEQEGAAAAGQGRTLRPTASPDAVAPKVGDRDGLQIVGLRSGAARSRRDPSSPLEVVDLGRKEYREVWELQKQLVAQRYEGRRGDIVLVVEHPPVITVGRGSKGEVLKDERFDVVEVERGGQATYHGPGQVVVYPIVKLAEGRRDLHAWMAALEQAVIDTVGAFGVEAGRREGATGVWLDGQRKLCSIGVAASRWVTWHGLALNHEPDLEHFAAIDPCGFDASVMTSLAAELGAAAPARGELVEVLVARLGTSIDSFREA